MTFPGRYILDENGKVIPELNLIKWAMWFEKANRVVKQETIGDWWISTVFLGLDHNFEDGPPILWETLAFKSVKPRLAVGRLKESNRCSGNREQAEAMHLDMVERIQALEALKIVL